MIYLSFSFDFFASFEYGLCPLKSFCCISFPLKILSAWTRNLSNLAFDRTAPINKEIAYWFFFNYFFNSLFSLSSSSFKSPNISLKSVYCLEPGSENSSSGFVYLCYRYFSYFFWLFFVFSLFLFSLLFYSWPKSIKGMFPTELWYEGFLSIPELFESEFCITKLEGCDEAF